MGYIAKFEAKLGCTRPCFKKKKEEEEKKEKGERGEE